MRGFWVLALFAGCTNKYVTVNDLRNQIAKRESVSPDTVVIEQREFKIEVLDYLRPDIVVCATTSNGTSPYVVQCTSKHSDLAWNGNVTNCTWVEFVSSNCGATFCAARPESGGKADINYERDPPELICMCQDACAPGPGRWKSPADPIE